MKRVLVTGIGVVSPIGIGREDLWHGLQTERIGIRRITRFDPSQFHCQVAGEVHGFHPEQWIPEDAIARMDRYSRFVVAAGQMAMNDGGLDPQQMNRERLGCFVGSALGGVSHGELQYERYHTQGVSAVDRLVVQKVPVGAGPSNLAIQLGAHGPASANSDSCASGPIAIGRAVNAIRRGEADVALAGGAEASLTPLAFGAFDLIRAMSTHYNHCPESACRPFDSRRDGFVMGEGSALLLLESEEHAGARGAVPIAEVAGIGVTNDAYHMTAPRPDASQASRAVRLALADAGITAEDIDVVSAHGSGTPLNDTTETLALKLALKDRAYQIPVVGTKSRHAHSLGATGAIEAAVFSLCLHHQWIPGALNLAEPDPACDLDYGRSGPSSLSFSTVLSTSFGFGGINAALILRRIG